MLLPFLLIAVVGFVVEVGIQFHLIKPVPKHVQKREESRQPSRPNTNALTPELTNQK
jgi:hypothetical protein